MNHLKKLEAESIYILREVAVEFENPVMLYSIGKDSSVMLHLAKKAFYPAKIPFPLLHVDTTWKFKEMISFRDKIAKKDKLNLIVHINQEGVKNKINPFNYSSQKYTAIMKTESLLQALNKGKFDAALGGARRDEEKSRAKERIFSFRDKKNQWDPRKQRPELWNLYNGKIDQGESIRVFPLSNWTELDVWLYINLEKIPIIPLYFAKKRQVIDRKGVLIMLDDERFPLKKEDKPFLEEIRFRTLGCYPLSGAIRSKATTVKDIIKEMLVSENSEREGRVIDYDVEGSMETKKKEGYF